MMSAENRQICFKNNLLNNANNNLNDDNFHFLFNQFIFLEITSKLGRVLERTFGD